MLDTKSCEDYLAEVMEYAKDVNLLENLKDKLEYLATYNDPSKEGNTRCVLYSDFSPRSFVFTMYQKNKESNEETFMFNGGLIFHGAHDNYGSGSAPTYSVSLVPTNGWQIHT